MNILVDAHCFDQTAAEGITTYIRGIYSWLPKIMPEARFFFAAHKEENLGTLLSENPNSDFVKLNTSSWLKRNTLDFPRLIKKVGADWTHFQYTAPENAGCRIIITLHDVLFKDFPTFFPLYYRITRDLLFRRSALRADILATVSDYSRQRIASHYRIHPDKIILTPNAVNPEFFDVDREEARRKIDSFGIRNFILNVSRIEPRKNQLALVKAFHSLRLAEKGLDLVLINHPSIPVPKLEQYIANLPSETKKHIYRFDSKSFNELKYWYAAANLFVFPSLAEGFGIPPLEAAATRTPVICHNDTAMADYSFFGPNLANISQPGTLENLITENLFYVSSPTEQNEVSLSRIADSVRSLYNWKHSAETLANAIRNSTP